MRKTILSFISVSLLAGFIVFSVDKTGMTAGQEEDIVELKKQMEVLQKRIDELESSLGQRRGQDTRRFYNRGPADRWDPFTEMERIQEEMNQMFRDSFNHRENWGKGMPGGAAAFDYNLDLKETDNSYVITLDMSGLDKDKVGVEINENSVTVKGEYSQEKKEEGPGRYFSSSGYGSFLKTMPLPVDADTSKLKSEKKGDNFVITIPKK